MAISKIQRTEIDLSDYLDDVPDRARNQALKSIGNQMMDSIKDYLVDGKSPIDGKSFQKLSKDYAENKKGGDTTPNLYLSGNLWGNLDFEIDDNVLIIGVDSEDEWKADGHNKLSSKANNKIPQRRFIADADENETYKDLNNIIKDTIPLYEDKVQSTLEEIFQVMEEKKERISISDIKNLKVVQRIKPSSKSVTLGGIQRQDIEDILKGF